MCFVKMTRACVKETETVRSVKEMWAKGKRGRKRPKKRWLDVTKSDIKRVAVSVDNMGNRVKWKLRTRVADLK